MKINLANIEPNTKKTNKIYSIKLMLINNLNKMSESMVDQKEYDLRKIIEDKNYLNIRKRVEIKVILPYR